MKTLIHTYKRSAEKKGHSYELTEKQFKELSKQDCHYCGAKPNNIHRSPEGNGVYAYNGLDRVDNNKGYAIDNVGPCCKKCNYAKKASTLQEYQDWIKNLIIKYLE